MKYVIINSMSRNGSSLIYQLLFGHSELSFYPSRIDFGCSLPRGWPFYNYKNNNSNEYADQLIAKHFNEFGTSWKNIIHTSLDNDKYFDRVKFKSIFNEMLNLKNDDNNRQKILFNTFIKSYFAYKQYEYNKYIVLQEDHLFNFSPKNFVKTLDDVMFIQTIRNLKDVIASRKNMLLFHNKFQGDPKVKTLFAKVIKEESLRWLWSVIAAYFNYTKNKNNYMIFKFETLKRNPYTSMKYLTKKLNIDFEDILLDETKEKSNHSGYSGMLLADSSLKYTSKNKFNNVIETHKHTLNEEEIDIIYNFEYDFNLIEFYNIDENNYINELCQYVENNLPLFKKNIYLLKFINQYEDNEFIETMNEYSSLNHGQKQASNSFKEGF
ncbi:MAG: sulfotransferase [Sulfurimonas denitrificans]|nr:sulfotransferase [Sulfurimonas denitrificans]